MPFSDEELKRMFDACETQYGTAHKVRVAFQGLNGTASFSGPVSFVSFGSEQYVWHDVGSQSHADPDHAPIGTTVIAGAQTTFTLPKASIPVLRGHP